MTCRRSVLLVTGLCAVAALAVTSDTLAGVPTGDNLVAAASSHRALPGRTVGELSRPVVRHPDRGAVRGPAGSVVRPGVRTTTSTVTDGASGGEEAGRQESLVRRVSYTGAPQVTFSYPGASYVKVHFTRLLVRPGDWVTVTDPAGAQRYTYHGDPRLLPVRGDSPVTDSGPGGFWAMSITGDTALVTLHRSLPGPGTGTLGVDVDRVAHGFTAAERSVRAHDERIADNRQPESLCGQDDSRDAVCYRTQDPVAYQHSLPVARLLINGTTLCTAWRLTADNRMMTNNHCISGQSDVRNSEVWFNYQCSVCGGKSTEPVTKVPGGDLVRTDPTLDYALFTVANFAAVQRFGYLNLDPRLPRTGEEVYIPQHPEGEPTKLSVSSDADPAAVCRIDMAEIDGYAARSDTAYRCDTEPGSSGSPVISRQTNAVLAIHHLGGCPNSGVRMDLIYAQIRNLL